MKFTLLRFDGLWHARLDAGGYRFVQWSDTPRSARAIVFLKARAVLGGSYRFFGLEPHCSRGCYKPDFPF